MKILVAGDFCPQHRVADRLENGDYESIFGNVKNIISDADYSIVNFECPVTYGGEKPIMKCGPNLQCSDKGLEAVKWAGFDCVTLANNHFLDYGEKGVENTLEACSKYHIDTVGGGGNLREASQILYKEINGSILAIINCCEHEFSIATETTAGSNPLNPIQQFYTIKEARTKADYVLVIVHGGHEQYNLPSPRMQETYRFFIDAGADAVVNHHQHCYSGYEIYKEKPIFYGLGNFCFDKADKTDLFGWNDGYMVSLDFTGDKGAFEIIPYRQCKKKPSVEILPIGTFNNELKELNTIIANSEKLKEKASQYYHDSMKSISYIVEPIQNRYVSALQRRGLLPRLWSKRYVVKLQNYVMCEAHKDKMDFFFKHFND